MPIGQSEGAGIVHGNLDNVVITSTYINSGGFPETTNLGVSWRTSGRFPTLIMLDFILQPYGKDVYAIGVDDSIRAHTPCEVNPIYKSTDVGTTWTEMFRPSKVLVGCLVISGCAIYAQYRMVKKLSETEAYYYTDEKGLVRSTDNGMTWKDIDGPYNNLGPQANQWQAVYDLNERGIAATANGAIVYALDTNYDLWKTTDGGDGTLSAAFPYSISLSHSLATVRQDTLVVNECDSVGLRTLFSYASCDHAPQTTPLNRSPFGKIVVPNSNRSAGSASQAPLN